MSEQNTESFEEDVERGSPQVASMEPEFEALEKDVHVIVSNISKLVDLEMQGMDKLSQGEILRKLVHEMQTRQDIQYPPVVATTPSIFAKKSGFDNTASTVVTTTPRRNFELGAGANRMLSNALNACVRQRVSTNVVCENNAHDDIKKKDRENRLFYSRTRLLELRPTVADTLCMQEKFPRIPGLFIQYNDADYPELTSAQEVFVNRVQAIQRVGSQVMRKKIGSTADADGAWERGIEVSINSNTNNNRRMFGAHTTPHREYSHNREYTPSRSHHNHGNTRGNAGNYSQRQLEKYGASPSSGKLNIAYDYFGNQVLVDDKPLEKSENAWTPLSIKSQTSKSTVSHVVPEGDVQDEETKQAVLLAQQEEQRKEFLITLRGFLNKQCVANMDACVAELTPKLPTDQPDLVDQQSQTVYTQCLRDSAFMHVYALLLCKLEPHLPNSLRKTQVSLCQVKFAEYNQAEEHDQQQKALCKQLGHLYLLDVVVSKIILAVSELSLKTPRDGHVDGLVEMLSVCGEKLDKHATAPLDTLMLRVADLAKNGSPGLSKRLQFKLKDLQVLRQNKWVKK